MTVRFSPPETAEPHASSRPVVIRPRPTLLPTEGVLLEGKTFREIYCARFEVPNERFEIDLLRRCLPAQARLLAPMLRRVTRNFFDVDVVFLRAVGAVRTTTGMRNRIEDFRDDPRNRRWSRMQLNLRVSTRRLLDIADEIVPYLVDDRKLRSSVSRAPFN
jgi:hypothetical protein